MAGVAAAPLVPPRRPAPAIASPRPVPGWIDGALLAVLSGWLFFYGLTAGEMYRNEGLRAIVAAEFLRSGNWVVPTLYGEPLFTKPPGMYAAVAAVSAPFGGVRDWTVRLPSALAATATVFAFYAFFRRRLGRAAGLTAGVVLPLSLMWLDKASAGEIDMLQAAWVAASILCLDGAVRAAEARDRPRRCTVWWVGALLCVAAGVLTKWTAPAFFYLTAVALLWRRGQLRLLWSRAHLAAVAVAAAVCGAWVAAAVARAGWEPLYATVRQEALMRLSPAHHHRVYPWAESLAHPFRIWAASLPVAAFALPALWPGFSQRWHEPGRRVLQLLHCWLWPSLAFWTLTPEHAARQSFPLYPAIAGLAAMVWLAWITGRLAWPFRTRPAYVLAACVVGWCAVKFAFVHVVVPDRTGRGAPWLHAWLPDGGRKREPPREKGAAIARLVPEGRTLYVFRLKDEGIMFYYGRPVRRLAGPAQLPSTGEPLYCMLDGPEWDEQQRVRPAEALLRINDSQGAPIVLVRTRR